MKNTRKLTDLTRKELIHRCVSLSGIIQHQTNIILALRAEFNGTGKDINELLAKLNEEQNIIKE